MLLYREYLRSQGRMGACSHGCGVLRLGCVRREACTCSAHADACGGVVIIVPSDCAPAAMMRPAALAATVPSKALHSPGNFGCSSYSSTRRLELRHMHVRAAVHVAHSVPAADSVLAAHLLPLRRVGGVPLGGTNTLRCWPPLQCLTLSLEGRLSSPTASSSQMLQRLRSSVVRIGCSFALTGRQLVAPKAVCGSAAFLALKSDLSGVTACGALCSRKVAPVVATNMQRTHGSMCAWVRRSEPTHPPTP